MSETVQKFFMNRVDHVIGCIAVDVGEKPIVLGRGAVLLDIDESSISRHHFELRTISGSAVLLKCKSRNAITILKNNGIEVKVNTEKEGLICIGDIIKLTRHKFHYQFSCAKSQIDKKTLRTSKTKKVLCEETHLIKTMQSQLESIEIDNHDLKSSIKVLRSENDDLKSRIKTLTSKDGDLRSSFEHLKINVDCLLHENTGLKSVIKTLRSGLTNVIVLGLVCSYYHCIVNSCLRKKMLTQDSKNRYLMRNGQMCKISLTNKTVCFYANYQNDSSREQLKAVQEIIESDIPCKIVFSMLIELASKGTICRNSFYQEQINFVNKHLKQIENYSVVIWSTKEMNNCYAHSAEDERLVRNTLAQELLFLPRSVILVDCKDWISNKFDTNVPTITLRQRISDFVANTSSF